MRGSIDTHSWTKAIWYPHAIPRHSFHSWLVTLNRCPTKDMMLQWGLQVTPTCLLCNLQVESRNHLYFDCGFSYDLWTLIASRSRIIPRRSWDETILQMQSLPSEKAFRLLVLLSWQAILYWLWNERNNRLHSNTFRSIDSIFSLIDRQIRNKIQSFRYSSPILCSKMMQRWFDLPSTRP